MNEHELSPEQIDEILYVIENQSFSKSGLTGEKLSSVAGQIVQDADRLEAVGAIGIGRAFLYSGHRGSLMHDSNRQTRTDLDTETYRKEENTVIQHFYEKILKLKDLMNTKTGKKIAEHRHQFAEEFLAEFLAEWSGEK